MCVVCVFLFKSLEVLVSRWFCFSSDSTACIQSIFVKHWFLRGFLSDNPSCPLGKSHDDHSGMLGIHKEERGVKTEPCSSGKELAF